MVKLKVEELLSLNETIASSLLKTTEYPWEALSKIKLYITMIGSILSDDYERTNENTWISKSAKVSETAYIADYTIIDHNAEIRHNAYIRGNAIIGKSCVVGNSSELKNVILFNEAKVPHYNYVGDSILGHKAHMGAGSITSNVKSDKSVITIKTKDGVISTNLHKFGAILGDNVEIGCNAVLNPGTVIGKNTNIYPLISVRGYIEENSILKKENQLVKKI